MIERKKFPESYPLESRDRLSSLCHPCSGLFELAVSCPDCSAWVYIPADTEYSAWSVTILLPSGADLEDFLCKSGWLEVADDSKIVLFLARKNASCWSRSASDDEMGAIRELDLLLDKKAGYDVQRFFSYLVGYGDGANTALSYAIENPSSYAGLACVGSISRDWQERYSAAGALEGASYISKDEVPLPVLFFCDEESLLLSGALEHFKKRNKVGESHQVKGNVCIWSADRSVRRDLVNAQLVGDIVWIKTPFESQQVGAAHVWDKLHRYIRTSGFAGGFLHPFRTVSQWGLRDRKCKVDGIERRWLEYIPERNVSRVGKRPLVIFFHGNSQTGKSSVYANEWINVAESRDFIACFPTGGLTKRDDDAFPVPGWNASASESLLDDDGFVRALVANYVDRGLVDKARVYACGHSMGSAMTQRCAMALPDIFAAVASNSGVVCGGRLGRFDAPGVVADAIVPVWVQMGEYDIGGGSPEENEDIEKTLNYWLNRYGLGDANKGEYLCGRYSNTVWRDKNGVPLLRMTTTFEKTHSITPQDSWLYYDEFFSHYSRENGRLFFDGVPV